MSDQVLEEEDDLISQDDIDKMLDISSGDEDEGELSQDDIDSLLNGPDPDEDDADAGEDDAGELSQDDIDRMMSGDGPGDDDAVEEDEGELSQDDIDSLLNAPDQDEDDADAGEDDAGELSQDDIDSLLNMPDSDEDEADAGEDEAAELSQDDIDSMMSGDGPGDDDSVEDDDGELSQNDIDRMMGGDAGGDDDGDDDELISLEDIQEAMDEEPQENEASEPEIGPDPDPVPAAGIEAEAETEPEPEAVETDEAGQDDAVQQEEDVQTAVDAPATEASSPKEDPLDEPIEEDQAADVADCMITQEAMDALIEAGLPAPDVPQEDAASAQTDDGDAGDETLSEQTDPEPDPEPETEDAVPQDAVPAEDDDDVTQEDIDALLQESDEKDGALDEDEDILISQDDINTLLMAADQDDDDVLDDLVGEDDVAGLADQLDDQQSDSGDQVVLEGIENAEISEIIGRDETGREGAKKGGKIKALLKSKIVLAAASVLLFMGISIPLSYFLFFSGDSDSVPLPERPTNSLTEIDLIRDGQADTPALPPSRTSGTIVLADFIILASDQSQTMTYVYADVSIDYSDQRAYDEINSNLAFYRDLIYGAIQGRLVSEKNNEVTEADLLWGVEASLKKVLPPQYIDKISFKSFKAT